MATFYLSSTFEDLKDHRSDVRKLLRRRGHKVICMEEYGTSVRTPLATCLQDVARSDVYVGIVAWRYGFIPPAANPDRYSMTECEYRHATGLNPPKESLLFLLAQDAPWPRNLIEEGDAAERLKEFRKHLSENHTVCFFKSRRDLRRKVRKEVKRFSHTRSFWEWLKDLLPDWPWYATLTAAVGVALLTAALGIGVYYWSLSRQKRAEFLIRYGIWDSPFADSLDDSFSFPPENTDAGQCVPPNANLWSYTGGQWCLTNDKALSIEALLIKGPDWGLRKVPEGTTLYDFKVKFFVIFRRGDEAAWVVRAREGGRVGYVFKLKRQRGEGGVFRLFLNGWAYTPGGQQVTLGKTPNNELLIGDIYEKDYFIVTLTAKENVFSHTLKLMNENDEGTDRAAYTQVFKVDDFTDPGSRFPYAGFGLLPHGSVGFFAPPESEIIIDQFERLPLEPTAPPP